MYRVQEFFFFQIKISLYEAMFSAGRQRNRKKGMFKVETFWLFNFLSFSFLSESKSSYMDHRSVWHQRDESKCKKRHAVFANR